MTSTTASLSLAERLRERIRSDGPITFHDWMQAALYDPEDGYYCKPGKIKWGREGDYRTSPERTRLFAATFTAYFARLYEKLGAPPSWTIVEAGAGNGFFALDVLQTLRGSYPHVFAATTYCIAEASPDSVLAARENLREFFSQVQFVQLSHLPKFRGVVFSNELFDAFPVHRIQLRDGVAQELFVTVDTNDHFEWTLRAPSEEIASRLDDLLADMDIDTAQDQIVEVNVETERWIENVAGKIDKGFIVTVDYGGDTHAKTDGTLRGFSSHDFVENPLASPGENDLTSNVNWNLIKTVGSRHGLSEIEFARQDQFLLSHGFLDQLEVACRVAGDDSARMRLRNEAREMILPNGMASHFQVLVQQKC